MAAFLHCSCLFRNPLPWLATLGSFLAFAYSSELGFLTMLLTSSAVILYPVILMMFCSKSSQQKSTHKYEDTTDGKENGSLIHEDSCQNVERNVAQMKNEQVVKGGERSEKKEDEKGREVLLSSSETVSDSESFDHTSWSDGSENDWIFRENLSHSTQCSDGSISDEEGLIEIALPEGHYVESSKMEEEDLPSYGFQHKSHFRNPNWMEMLMEEDNLIEIDICMGSIKCSRFEIEA